jgi:hypothetical protein
MVEHMFDEDAEAILPKTRLVSDLELRTEN